MMELKEPTEICDVSELGAVMWNHTFDSLMEAAVLRSRDEILDMQDFPDTAWYCNAQFLVKRLQWRFGL